MVGFEVLGLRDSSRSLADEPRPIQIALWYPADGSPGSEPVIYRDYFLLTATERTLAPLNDSLGRATLGAYRELLSSHGVEPEAMEQWLSSPMAATREVPASAGRFPLVLVSPGTFHAAFHHAILAEYLASHGYVVAIAPAPSRLAGPPHDVEEVVALAKEQAADLAYVRDALSSDPRIDVARSGIVAHSFGARSTLLALLDGSWRAMVSLDGGIGNAHGGEWLTRLDQDPTSIDVPILHLFEDVDPEVVAPDFSVLRSLQPEPVVVKVDTLHHVHFTSLGLVSGLVPGLAVGPASPGVVTKSAAVHEATRRFLDGWVRNADGDMAAFDSLVAASAVLHRARLTDYP